MRAFTFLTFGFLLGFLIIAIIGRRAAKKECQARGHLWDTHVVGEMEYLFCGRCGRRG